MKLISFSMSTTPSRRDHLDCFSRLFQHRKTITHG